MLVLKACPRCHGDLILEVGQDTDYYECLQCGHVLSTAQEYLLGVPPTHDHPATRRAQSAAYRVNAGRQTSEWRRQPDQNAARRS